MDFSLVGLFNNMGFLNSMHRYGRLIYAVFKKLLAGYLRQVILITLLSFCSILFLTISFAGFFLLINDWINQDGLSVWLWTFYFYKNIPLTIATTTLLLILGISGAWCSFYIELVVARTAVGYYQACCLELIKLIDNPNNDGWQGFFSNALKQELSQMINTDLRKRGMISKHLLQGILPALICLVAAFIMFYMDWFLSTFVIALSSLFLPFFFKINQSTASMQKQFESLGKTYRSRFSEFLNARVKNIQTNSDENLSNFIAGDLFYQQKFLFLKRFIQGEKIQALNSTFFSIMIYLLIMFYILPSDNGILAWKELLIFAISFRFLLNSFRKVAGIISTCSRLYPGTNRLDQLVEYCRRFRHTETLSRNELFTRLTTKQITHLHDSDIKQIRSGRLHLIHMAAPHLNIDSIKQHMVMLVNNGVPLKNPLKNIEIIDDLSGLSIKELSNALDSGFDRYLERYEIGDSAKMQNAADHEPSDKTLLFYNMWIRCKENRIIVIPSTILSFPLYQFLKKFAKKEKHLLVFVITTKKALHKFPDGDDEVIVFKDFRPVVTSVKDALTKDKIDPFDDNDEMIEEI